jgi:uncharacterized protein
VLLGISLFAVPSIAQIRDIIVVGMAVISFAKAKHLSLKFTLPFLSSIPFAFFAGAITLPERNLALIFVLALFAASAALLLSGIRGRSFEKLQQEKKDQRRSGSEAMGNSENIINWGSYRSYPRCCSRTCRDRGGIWLSLLLTLSGMAYPKRAAATSSVFIVANSVSGFMGQSASKSIDHEILFPLALVVLEGELFRSRLGAFRP